MKIARSFVGASLCAATIVGVGGSVSAGESTGQGRGTPIAAEVGQADRVGKYPVAPSHCAFSGLEDNDGGAVTPGVVQTPAGVPGFIVSANCKGPATGALKD